MIKNRCQYLIKQISLIKELKLQYNTQLPLLPESRDICMQLRKEIAVNIYNTKETIRIKWTEYRELSQVELEFAADIMDDMITTDNDKIISISGNNILIYGSKTGKLVRKFRGSKQSFTSLADVGNGFFITGEKDDLLKLWNTKGGLIRTLKDKEHHLKKDVNISEVKEIIPLTKDLVVSIYKGAAETIIVWNINTGQEVKRDMPDSSNLNKSERHLFALSPTKIASTCGKVIKVWDINSNTSKTFNLTESKNVFSIDFGQIINIRPISEDKCELFIDNLDTSIILDIESGETEKTDNFVSPSTKKVFFTTDNNIVSFSNRGEKILEFADDSIDLYRRLPVNEDVILIKETADHKIMTIGEDRKITIFGDPNEDNNE